MRNLLALAAAALIGFAGIGWYLGWYKFESTPTPTGRDINIHLNTPKIKEDVGKGEQQVHDYLTKDKSTSNPPQSSPPATPTGFQRPDDNNNSAFPSGGNPSFAPVPPSTTSPQLPPPR